MTAQRPLPLAGARVIELTESWAGPMGGSLLGDLGADVIKVESYPRPSITRPTFPLPEGIGFAGRNTEGRFYDRYSIHHMANRNKRGIAVNLTTVEGKEILKRLVAGADAYMEGYSAGTIDKMGLGYDVVRALNPALVMLSMAGWGQKGPNQGYVTLGSGLDAASGHQALRGYRHASPIDSQPIYQSDALAALFASFLVIAGVRYRRRTGRGQHIDFAQSEGLFGHLARPFLQYQLTRQVPEPGGNDHPDYVVQGCYPVVGEDQWVAITVRDERDWRELCAQIPALAVLPMPAPMGLVGPRDELAAVDRTIADWTRPQTAVEVATALQKRGIPAMPAHDEEGVFDDPNFLERGFFRTIRHAEAGEITILGPLFKLLGTALDVRRPCNLYGEHNHEVLREIGYRDDEIEAFEQAKVIADELPTLVPPTAAAR